ncbi:hypothetical protein BGZ99_002420, partial [Dissophora globulifera]
MPTQFQLYTKKNMAHPLHYPKTSEIPVLISGAGPVGTFAAIMLTRLGVRCRIVERESSISVMSKALSIHARTLEIFQQTGLIDRFLIHGHPISDFNIYFNGVFSVFPGLVNSISYYNYALFLEQVKTSALLNEELERLGVNVDRGWELVDTKVIEEGAVGNVWVETTIRRAIDGSNIRSTESSVVGEVDLDAEQTDKVYETEVIRSRYLIGADGGKSVVRHKVNIPFLGKTLENNIILFDGNIETDLDLSSITVINGRNNRTMNIFPLSDGQVRIMVDGSELDPGERLTNEILEKTAQAAAFPAKLLVKSSSWLTFYRVNERQAESYSYKNSIFLAGDAAHVHSPAGGQGMNLGLQDAYNLTWKMALVINGLSEARILETYEAERAPVASSVIKMSSGMFALGFSCHPIYKIMRKIVTAFASYLVRFITVPPGTVSMLTTRYDENMINQHHKSQPILKEPFQVGQRAHDGPLLRVLTGGQLGEALRLHQLIRGPGTFHILVFTSNMLSPTATTPTSKLAGQQMVEHTNEVDLKHNIEQYLQQWRSQWAYGHGLKEVQPLFNIHVIGAVPETLSGPHFQDPSKIQADTL